MKAHPVWAGRAVKPRSRKAVREAQGLTARTRPKPVCQAEAGRHVEGTVARSQDPCACGDCRWALVQAGCAALWGERVKRDPLARIGAPAGGRAAEGARR